MTAPNLLGPSEQAELYSRRILEYVPVEGER
jgi:hypothetical protein